jgi:aspartate-semialdehyde dehydrogenase
MRAVLVGATGAVGLQILGILEQRDFPVDELVPVATSRSAGRRLPFRGSEIEVREISPEAFDGADIAFFDVPDEAALQWAPIAAEWGAVVVDNSAAYRLDPDVPLVVPEVNPGAVHDRPKGIIASPNCTMLTLVVPLGALHRAATVQRVIASSYQAASGAGKAGVDELWDQVNALEKDPEAVLAGLGRDVLEAGEVWQHPLAMNVIPQVGSFRDNGYTGEELKVEAETRKVLDLPDLPVTITCVRVPTIVGHGVAAHIEFDRALTPDEARSVLQEAAGVEVLDDPANGVYPTPLEAAGRDPCYVGRIRQDLSDPKALEIFSVADNLRKGAALNTVQIAELLVASMSARPVIALVVQNRPGVLARVATVIHRYNANIEALTVDVGDDPSAAKITVVISLSQDRAALVCKRLEKLIDVISVRQENATHARAYSPTQPTSRPPMQRSP